VEQSLPSQLERRKKVQAARAAVQQHQDGAAKVDQIVSTTSESSSADAGVQEEEIHNQAEARLTRASAACGRSVRRLSHKKEGGDDLGLYYEVSKSPPKIILPDIRRARDAESEIQITTESGDAAHVGFWMEVDHILRGIRSCAADSGALEERLRELCNLFSSDVNKVFSMAPFGVDVPLSAMRKQEAEAGGEEVDANKVAVADAGGIDNIVRAMRAQLSSAGVQVAACKLLKILAGNYANSVSIANAGGIKVILISMGTHEANVGVQEGACAALCNLAMYDANRLAIANAGGIEVIVSAMRTHKANVGVQEAACKAVGNLAVNDANVVAIADAGGIEVIVSAMRTHEANVGVQVGACGALGKLAVRPHSRHWVSLQRRLWICGCRNHTNDPVVQVAKAGGIDPIVNAMRRHPEIRIVQETACDVLILLTQTKANRAAIRAAGAAEVVSAAMASDNASNHTQTRGQDLLRVITGETRAHYMLAGLQEAVLRMKKKIVAKQHAGSSIEPDSVQVLVVGATGLKNSSQGPPDAMVVLMCGDQVTATRVVYGSVEPLWNERIQMILPTDGRVDSMVAVVFDTIGVNNNEEPTPLGIARINFSTLQDQRGYDDRVWPLAEYSQSCKEGDGSSGYLHLKVHRFCNDLGASIPNPGRPASPIPHGVASPSDDKEKARPPPQVPRDRMTSPPLGFGILEPGAGSSPPPAQSSVATSIASNVVYSGTVHVKVVKADGLRMHLCRKPAPLVMLRVSVAGVAQPCWLKTNPIPHTRSPEWDQEFVLPVTDASQAQLECTIWDTSDAMPIEFSHFLGEVLLNLAKLIPYNGHYVEQVFFVKQGKTIKSDLEATGMLRLGIRLDVTRSLEEARLDKYLRGKATTQEVKEEAPKVEEDKPPVRVTIGLSFAYNDEQEVIVDSVTANGPAAKTGLIQRGDVVCEVGDTDPGGKPMKEVYKQPIDTWAPIVMNGAPGSSVRFILARHAEQKRFIADVVREVAPS